LDEFLPLCEGVRRVKGITSKHVEAFKAALRARGCSDRACSNKFNRLRSWIKFCRLSTAFMGKQPRLTKPRPTIYSKTEIAAFRSAADATMRIVIDLCYSAG
jgi:hypothetical protein